MDSMIRVRDNPNEEILFKYIIYISFNIHQSRLMFFVPIF